MYIMIRKSIQEILPLVEKPSSYLGTEINSVKKQSEDIKLWFALAFPDLYEIGTSHFGLQILYHILNKEPDIAAERVFAPGIDMEERLKSSQVLLPSLESKRPLNSFDIVGVSLLYELNYTNILTMLDLGGIKFYSRDRGADQPFVIAGGPCACNSEPVADFFDAVVIGDGEEVVRKMARAHILWKENNSEDKGELLAAWSKIPGVYVPSFFTPVYHEINNSQTLIPVYPDYTKIRRTIVADLNAVDFPDAPIIPFGRPVHDRLRVEVSRGCSRGCRFCQAGMIYRPVRERSMKKLFDISTGSLHKTGYEDISLLSLSTGDYGCIVPFMEKLMNLCQGRQTAVSFPSLRAGTLTPELMKLVKSVRKTGFTIAPEAGSQRLRDVINKNICEAEIIDTVKNAFDMGWQLIKLYFMIGLPTEEKKDIDAIVEMVHKLRKIKGKKSKINVSIGTFVPKPHTPFQWEGQLSLEDSKERIAYLKKELRIPGIRLKWQMPEVSALEGLWARGDRRLSDLLISAYKKGCRFDGWTDHFDYQAWQDACMETGIDPSYYTTRSRSLTESLPWDVTDIGVSKEFLAAEREKAFMEVGAASVDKTSVAATVETTPDCRTHPCNDCGVCDFESITPRLCDDAPVEGEQVKDSAATDQRPPGDDSFFKVKIGYSKQKDAKFFGHLEMISLFARAIRRAGISIAYTKGFHPKPKMAFADTLPIGVESMDESMYLSVYTPKPSEDVAKNIIDSLNRNLPEGLMVHDCLFLFKKPEPLTEAEYRIRLTNEAVFDSKYLESFQKADTFIMTRINRKGKTIERDLKQAVLAINLKSSVLLELTLSSVPGKAARPFKVIKEVFDLSDDDIRLAETVKLRQNRADQSSSIVKIGQ